MIICCIVAIDKETTIDALSEFLSSHQNQGDEEEPCKHNLTAVLCNSVELEILLCRFVM